MRDLLLAVLLLTVPLAGCLDGEEAYTLEAPTQPASGLLLTYEIDRGDGPETQQLMVYDRPTGPGYDLVVYNGTRTIDSPFSELAASGAPRALEWKGFVSFPLIDGESYEAEAVAAVREATVGVEALDNATEPFEGQRSFRLTATGPDGQGLATVEYLEQPTIPSKIEITAGEDTETWRLVEMTEHPGWNQPPKWTLGRWWTYDAITRVEGGALAADNMTMVFTERAPGQQGIQHAFLNTVELEDREAALPFHQLRSSDLASQSGLLNPLISKMWSWPLGESTTWAGTTLVGTDDRRFSTTVELVRGYTLPDDTRTVALRVEAELLETGRIVGSWTYAPLVAFLTELELRQVPDEPPQLDWELQAWGETYHGPMELPRSRSLAPRETYKGPANVTLNLTVEDPIEIVEVRGFVGRTQDGSPDNRLTLRDPNGTVHYELDEDAFSRDTGFSFAEARPAQVGNWTLSMELKEGTSVLLTGVRGIWAEVVQKDYRS